MEQVEREVAQDSDIGSDVFLANASLILAEGYVPGDRDSAAPIEDANHQRHNSVARSGRVDCQHQLRFGQLQRLTGLQQVFRLERSAVILTTGEWRDETIYGLISLAATRATAAELLFLHTSPLAD